MTAAHPLRGPARWLILPCVGAAAGALGGVVLSVPEGELSWGALLWGMILGAAPGVAVAWTSRIWLAALIAPALAWSGLILSCWVEVKDVEWITWDRILYVASVMSGAPAYQLLVALTTIPAACLHGLRFMARGRWALLPAALHLGVAAIVTGCMERFEGVNKMGLGALAGLFFLLALGQIAGIEAALRMSRTG